MEVDTRHQKRLAIIEDQHEKLLKKKEQDHSSDMRQQISKAYKNSRDGTKTIVILKEQLKQSERNAKSLKLEAEDRIWLEVEANGKQLTEQNDLVHRLLESNLKHEHFIKQQSLLKCHGQLKKSVHGLEQKVETLEKENEDAKEEMIRTEESVAIRVKEAVTAAKLE